MALVDQKNLYLTFKYIAYTKILREYAKLNFSQIGAKRRGEGRGRKEGRKHLDRGRCILSLSQKDCSFRKFQNNTNSEK